MNKTWWAGLAVVSLLVAGCGGDDDEPDADPGRGDTSSDAPPADPGTDEPAAPEEELPIFCDLLTPEQVGEALGGAEVQLETGPLDACEFSQSDVYEYSGSLGAVVVDTGNGGYEGFKGGIEGTLDDVVVHDIEGLGEQAFVTTGSFGGSEHLQAAGGVLADGVLLTVNISQVSGHSEDEMVAAGEKLLRLMVESAG
jgi:hypothetical protein